MTMWWPCDPGEPIYGELGFSGDMKRPTWGCWQNIEWQDRIIGMTAISRFFAVSSAWNHGEATQDGATATFCLSTWFCPNWGLQQKIAIIIKVEKNNVIVLCILGFSQRAERHPGYSFWEVTIISTWAVFFLSGPVYSCAAYVTVYAMPTWPQWEPMRLIPLKVCLRRPNARVKRRHNVFFCLRRHTSVCF